MSSRNQRRKELSQNFIRNRSIARRIVARSGIGRDDLVLEVGSGKGILTRELALSARRVIAVESDPHLAAATRELAKRSGNVEVRECDFLDFSLPDCEYKVVANVPFAATSAIVDRLTNEHPSPSESCLLVQREAAERFLGIPKTTLVSVLLFPWFETSIVDRFRRSDFVPRPRVDTVLMRLRRRPVPSIDDADGTMFRDFVTYGFCAWAPDIRTAYSDVLQGRARLTLENANIDLSLRPSEVTVDMWVWLFRVFRDEAPPRARRKVAGAHSRLKEQQSGLKKSHRTRSACMKR